MTKKWYNSDIFFKWHLLHHITLSLSSALLILTNSLTPTRINTFDNYEHKRADADRRSLRTSNRDWIAQRRRSNRLGTQQQFRWPSLGVCGKWGHRGPRKRQLWGRGVSLWQVDWFCFMSNSVFYSSLNFLFPYSILWPTDTDPFRTRTFISFCRCRWQFNSPQ